MKQMFVLDWIRCKNSEVKKELDEIVENYDRGQNSYIKLMICDLEDDEAFHTIDYVKKFLKSDEDEFLILIHW